MAFLWVAAGGALGSVARFWLATRIALATGADFPWGTLLINVLGSFVIAAFGAATTRFNLSNDARVFVTVGLCGGFTTFSSFSQQTIQLIREGYGVRAGAYIAVSVILCLGACALGVVAGGSLAQPGIARG